ncbi:MAG: aldehyde dehydrogenase family protein, partial [Deltaproteobacteria bacterium]|nr:aldehyde dehydrogenase family protein [Deltaproteobacteria bacterium]
MQHRKIQVLGNFIDGEFHIPSPADEILTSLNPANTKDVIGNFPVSCGDIDKGVSAARSAKEKWANLSLEERIAPLRSYQHILRSRISDLAELIAREVGKPLWEAEGEVKAMISKIDITIEESLP